MDNKNLESIIRQYIDLGKQVKELNKIRDGFKDSIKSTLITKNKKSMDIGKFHIELTHIKQDRLDKGKVLLYVNKTGGNMGEMYKIVEFDRLDVLEISDNLEMVNIDL